MHIAYFTERPYRHLADDEIYDHGSYFGISNARFDRVKAADDYTEYHDQYRYAEEVGFDGIALNEHHANPICMGSVVNIEAAIAARITEQVRIFIIGNPVPTHGSPLRLAEELAMIDLVSKGRLVSGWVRGAGPEQFANNTNPATNREKFEEAHDFILDAWTRPGPWRYEGKHFHFRHVNPWALPYQQPVPTIIPGVLSRETAEWAADHSYPYLGLGAALKPSAELWNIYAARLASHGKQAGPENFGHLIQVYVDETEERAEEIGRNFLYGGGNGAFGKAEHNLPPGFQSGEALKRLAKAPQGGWLGVSAESLDAQTGEAAEANRAEKRSKAEAAYARLQQDLMVVVGTPDTVTEKIKVAMAALRPGHLFLMNLLGSAAHQDRRRSMELLGRHVLPELKAEGDRLGLPSMFDRQPGSVPLAPGQEPAPVADVSVIKEFVAAGAAR